ncbi:MAG: hypothetical protein ACI906_005188 [Candidatus Latescibacterota bacterium]|jgi:hypothetical protein
MDYLLNLNNLEDLQQSGAGFAKFKAVHYNRRTNVNTAYLLGQLILAVGAFGIISRAVFERAQEMGLLARGKEV